MRKFLLMLVIGGLLLLGEAFEEMAVPAAESITIMSAKMPSQAGAAIWDGQYAYIFGAKGEGEALDAVLRYDPKADQLVLMKAKLPTGRWGISAAWDGKYAYIFGGRVRGSGQPRSGDLTDQILRYNPASDSIQTMSATLPRPRYITSAVYDGKDIYVVAGYPWTGQIVRYDPQADTVSVARSSLRTQKDGTGSIWDGQYIYILGGDYGGDEIYRFDSKGDTIELLPNRLPGIRRGGAVWDGRYAYILGGLRCEGPFCDEVTDEIVRFDPKTETAAVLPVKLPHSMQSGPKIWDGGKYIYIFGGRLADGTVTNDIIRYEPSP